MPCPSGRVGREGGTRSRGAGGTFVGSRWRVVFVEFGSETPCPIRRFVLRGRPARVFLLARSASLRVRLVVERTPLWSWQSYSPSEGTSSSGSALSEAQDSQGLQAYFVNRIWTHAMVVAIHRESETDASWRYRGGNRAGLYFDVFASLPWGRVAQKSGHHLDGRSSVAERPAVSRRRIGPLETPVVARFSLSRFAAGSATARTAGCAQQGLVLLRAEFKKGWERKEWAKLASLARSSRCLPTSPRFLSSLSLSGISEKACLPYED